MWIRNQHGTPNIAVNLKCIASIYLEKELNDESKELITSLENSYEQGHVTIEYKDSDYNWAIKVNRIFNDKIYILGKYNSCHRAMEVYKEIQNFIREGNIMAVFNMPRE